MDNGQLTTHKMIRIIYATIGFFALAFMGLLVIVISPFYFIVALLYEKRADELRELVNTVFENEEQAKKRKAKDCPFEHSEYYYCFKPNGDCTFPNENHSEHPKG